MKQKNKIYIDSWSMLKPYDRHVPSDNYYLKVCNKVYDKINEKYDFFSSRYLGKKEMKLLSCFLTSYFEDIISGTNIWNSLISLHQEIYHKKLPFYNTDEYYENEPNEQDVSFLLWYFFNTIQKNKFIYPNNHIFQSMASEIVEIFDEEYEYAPENPVLKKYYEIDNNEDDYYIARSLLDKIFYKTYLFFTDTYLNWLEIESAIIEEAEDETQILHLLNESRDADLYRQRTRLLSMKANEWASKLVNKEPIRTEYLNMSKRIHGWFLYKGQNEKVIFMEHVASGKKFEMVKKSIDNHDQLVKVDSLMYIGIVRWKGEWWFSGTFAHIPYDEATIRKEKESLEATMAVQFIDEDYSEAYKALQLQLEAFIEFNKGSQIAFMPSSELDDFIKKSTEYFNDTILKKKKKPEKNKSLKLTEKLNLSDSHEDEIVLVFFNPKSGIEIAFDIQSAFPLAENKYYNEEESTQHLFHLLVSEELSTELAMYCIDNCKEKLAFFNSPEGKPFLDDIDFLLRFWKKDNYHTVPAITFV